MPAPRAMRASSPMFDPRQPVSHHTASSRFAPLRRAAARASALEPRTPRLALGLAAVFLLSLAAGLGLGSAAWSWDLVRELRLPRVLAAAGVGALLAQAGTWMQLLLRNPLADPYVLGASAGAGFGALIMLVLFGTGLWFGSTLGAAAALGLLLALGRRALAGADDEAPAQLILIGAMLAAVFAAGSTLLLALVPEQALRGAVFWLVGDLSGASGGGWLCLLAAALAAVSAWLARSLDRIALGAQHAWLLGEPVARLRVALLLLAALGTAGAVSQAGAIGFVGLVAPHVLRLFGVVRMRQQSWAVPLLGASLLVAADALARSVASPYELPVGAVTALLGAPVFVLLLLRRS